MTNRLKDGIKDGKIVRALIRIMICAGILFTIHMQAFAGQTKQIRLKNPKQAYKVASQLIEDADFNTRLICKSGEYSKYYDVLRLAEEHSPHGYWVRFRSSWLDDGYDSFQMDPLWYSKKKTRKIIQTENQKAEAIAKRIMRSNKSTYDRLKAANDYVCDKCDYDYYADSGNTYAWSAYGAFTNGKVVCAGYARAYDLILEKMNIPGIVVSGEAGDELDGHAWNMVQYNGRTVYVDVTWDDTGSDRWAFFLKTAREFIQSLHFWDLDTYSSKYLKWDTLKRKR